MNDRTFEGSLTGLTAVVLLWIILGIVLDIMAWGWLIVIGLAVEIVGGVLLLRSWGRRYMEKE